MRGFASSTRWIEEAGQAGAPRRPLEFLEKEKDRLEWRRGGS